MDAVLNKQQLYFLNVLNMICVDDYISHISYLVDLNTTISPFHYLDYNNQITITSITIPIKFNLYKNFKYYYNTCPSCVT